MTVKSGQSTGTVEVTPSGIPVYYQSQPKRLYRIGFKCAPTCSLDDLLWDAQRDETDWCEIPSVTTVLGVLDKSGPLVWWSMGVGIEGVLELLKRRVLREDHYALYYGGVCGSDGWLGSERADKNAIVSLLTEHKLTSNHVRDKAGDRGQAVHDALENWARHGHMPDPSIYPEEQEGYVRGLVAFLKDVPSAEPVGTEVLVASSEYGYAGRYDLRIRTNAEHQIVVRRTATRVRKRALKPGLYLADLKTSKAIYGSHARQLEAYEQASIESGYDPTDGRGVLLVTPDGGYEFKRSWATFEDFRVVLDVWNSDQEMAKRKKVA